MFIDRYDAARQLAAELKQYQGKNPLILAIPRGSVPMAKVIAEILGGEFDVVLVRKLRAPYQPELAIGSVDESGWVYLTPHAASTGANNDYIEVEKQAQIEIIRKRRSQYTPLRAPIDPDGRIVIVIDDGLATGATMIAALHGLRNRNPAKLICAVPVSPPETLKKMTGMADEVVCLEVHTHFMAVGQFYRDFTQVEDDEVIALLKDKSARNRVLH
jgi:putative phosphoribosyl transferase